MTATELKEELREDPSLWVSETADLFYVEPPVSGPVDPLVEDGPMASDVFALHSRPGASQVIYLDFDGQSVSGSSWNSISGAPATITATPFDTDGAPGTFSSTEQGIIESVWGRVAEDYAPFSVDVTTADPGASAIDRTSLSDMQYGTRVVFAGTPTSAYSALCPSGCGGVAYIDVFDLAGSNHGFYQPAWVFQVGLGGMSTSAKLLAEAASHEAGHNLSLQHDGTSSLGYYAGHGSWAPIMGVGYSKPIVQWSRGEYTGANNTEDDIALIASHGLSMVSDDHTSAEMVATTTSGGTSSGVIGTTSDVDTFSFTLTSGSWTFAVTPSGTSPDLDVSIELRNSSSTVLATSNPTSATVSQDTASGLDASITFTLAADTYSILVSSTGAGIPASTGYSSYGSLGVYDISVAPAGALPDLRPVVVSEPPAASVPNGTFSASATVVNEGDAAAAASTLTYRASTDQTLTAGDPTLTPTRTVPSLAAGATSMATTTVAVPAGTASGAYYLFACVDSASVVVESDETDSCLSSVGTVQITARPDLSITSLSAPPSAALAGGTSQSTTLVRNGGSASAAASTVRFWLSFDSTKDGGDVAVAESRAVTTLAIGVTSSGMTTLTVPNGIAVGSYHVIACADADGAVVESDETNNCLATTATMTIGSSIADLRVDVLGSAPATALSGGSFPLTATVANAGNASAASSTLGYRLSADTTVDGGDVVLGGTRVVPILAAAGVSSGSVSVMVPTTTPAGSYYVIACADISEAVAEGSESNNCRATSTTVALTVPKPDLRISAMANPVPTALSGGTLKPSITILNGGSATAAASTLRHWLSTDAVMGVGDVLLTGDRSIAAVNPAGTNVGVSNLTIPPGTAPGSYLLIACIDAAAVVVEADETNNCRASTTTVAVSTPSKDIGIVTLANPPTSALTGGTLSISVTIRSGGNTAMPASSVRFALSADQVADAGDTALAATRATATLAAGASSPGVTTATIPTTLAAGTYYLTACADPTDLIDEIDETNNCKVSTTAVSVTVPIADLRVSAIGSPPATGLTGAAMSISTSVTNGGTGSAPATTLRFWLSGDATLDGGDQLLTASRAVPIVKPAATSTSPTSITPLLVTTPGTYYVIACADYGLAVVESDELNNCRTSASTVVLARPTADLRVSALSAVPATSRTGGTFKPSLTVTNAGTGASVASTVRLRLSTDTTVDAEDIEVANGTVVVLADVVVGTQAVGALAARATATSAPTVTVPSNLTPGAYYLIVCADDDDAVDELDESDDCRVSTATIAVAQSVPDLLITVLTNPAATRVEGTVLSVTATVSNGGTASAIASDLAAYLSSDATAGSDVKLTGSRSVPALAAAATSAGTSSMTIPMGITPGSYFLVVCADDTAKVTESSESNNCRVSSTRVNVTSASKSALRRV